MPKPKKPSESGKVELTENELDDISGGPHFRTIDGLKPKPGGTESTFINSWKVNGFDGKGND